MNKCLNCEKDVKNKFCDTRCQNEYRGKVVEINYKLQPKLCKLCFNEIPFKKRKNLFCSVKCSNKSREGSSYGSKDIFENITDIEFKKLYFESTTMYEFYMKIGFPKKPRKEILSKIKKHITDLGLSFKIKSIANKTKGELFNERKNWQSARSAICKNARLVFIRSNKDKCCIKCGYEKHIEVCHVKGVSEFSDNTIISEINNIDNLIALCPNHHWEFDNMLIDLNDLK